MQTIDLNAELERLHKSLQSLKSDNAAMNIIDLIREVYELYREQEGDSDAEIFNHIEQRDRDQEYDESFLRQCLKAEKQAKEGRIDWEAHKQHMAELRKSQDEIERAAPAIKEMIEIDYKAELFRLLVNKGALVECHKKARELGFQSVHDMCTGLGEKVKDVFILYKHLDFAVKHDAGWITLGDAWDLKLKELSEAQND